MTADPVLDTCKCATACCRAPGVLWSCTTSTNTPEIFKGIFLMPAPRLAAIYTMQGWQGEESQSLKRTLSFNLIPLFQGQGERVQIFKIKQMPRRQPCENTLICFSTAWSKQRTEHPLLVRVCRWCSALGSKPVLWFYYLFVLCLWCDGQYSWLNCTPGDNVKGEVSHCSRCMIFT